MAGALPVRGVGVTHLRPAPAPPWISWGSSAPPPRRHRRRRRSSGAPSPPTTTGASPTIWSPPTSRNSSMPSPPCPPPRQGLTLVHCSAQLESSLTHKKMQHNLDNPHRPLNTGYTTPTRTPCPIQSAQVELKSGRKPLRHGRPVLPPQGAPARLRLPLPPRWRHARRRG